MKTISIKSFDLATFLSLKKSQEPLRHKLSQFLFIRPRSRENSITFIDESPIQTLENRKRVKKGTCVGKFGNLS